MASAPVKPVALATTATTATTATPATTPTVLDNWIALFKAHEKIIIIGIVAFTTFHLYSKGVDAYIQHENIKAQQATVVVKTDDAATKAIQSQLTELQATVATQTATIAKQISQRNQTTTQQQAVDRTLPPPTLAAHWESLLHIANGIDPATGQQFAVTQDAAVQTVVQLEEVPTLTANVASLQTELNNDTTIINKQQQVIAQLNTDLIDEKKSHVADVNIEKAKAKRSFLRGFKFGAVAGFIGGLFVGYHI